MGLGCSPRSSTGTPPVHPHVRGSWIGASDAKAEKVGSSPRAWVLAGSPAPDRRAFRFIPTCVGLGRAGPRPGPRPAVHPHVRGSWRARSAPSSSTRGSSPRAWVLVHDHVGRGALARFIPTCVGLGIRSGRGRNASTVHPHVRGSWGLGTRGGEVIAGSSPRAWVLADGVAVQPFDQRFIPTCVGLGGDGRAAARRPPVHPHVRGSWAAAGMAVACYLGSSPRAWVLDPHRAVGHVPRRFIPTCVGLGRAATSAGVSSAVHPHVRGSWPGARPQPSVPAGSSPRAWVLDAPISTTSQSRRFIPTCVGLGLRQGHGHLTRPVHPHVRGSWSRSRSMCPRCGGSSPRAWVLEPVEVDVSEVRRFIPTCVGLGRCRSARTRLMPVHPHVRGSWTRRLPVPCPTPGSSPRAWVLARHGQPSRSPHRFIPTCVGLGRVRGRPRPGRSVHPHVRGSWGDHQDDPVRPRGSSPRAWVLAALTPTGRPLTRFIPTCVGLGVLWFPWRPPGSVHPHVRGSWKSRMADSHAVPGSSPRAWVLAPGGGTPVIPGRFIPTCVGLGEADLRLCGALSSRYLTCRHTVPAPL